MKKIFSVLLILSAFAVQARDKEEDVLFEKTCLLIHTIFGSKDRVTLEKLFAKKATYGHSHGKIRDRREAIDGASHNQSTYSDTAISNINVIIESNTAVVRCLFRADENKNDETVMPLNFTMMLVWLKEDGDWKLMGRQAVSIH